MRIYQAILKLIRQRSVWVVSGSLAIALGLLVALLPWIIANTSLRNTLLTKAIPPDMHGTIGKAELGWFSPLTLHELEIARGNGQFRFDVERLDSRRSWFQLWWNLPDLDRIEIDQPTIDIVVPQSFDIPDTSPKQGLTLVATVNDANFIVRTPQLDGPIVDLNELDLVMRIECEEGRRKLVIEPVQIFDHHKLTPELCNHGLQLVAPILAQAASVEGAVSFELEKFRVPLDSNIEDEKAIQPELKGIVQLHDVTTGIKGPILQQVVRFMEAVFSIDIPNKLQVADGTDVHFHLNEGRVHHEGLTFLLPEISSDVVFKTSGSVGLDETLDLYVDVPLAATLIRDGPLARVLSQRAVQFHVTGTLNEPNIGFPKDWSLLRNLTVSDLADDGESESSLGASAASLLSDLLDAARGEDGQIETPLLDRLRELRGGDSQDSEASPEEADTPSRRRIFRRRGT